MTRNENSNNLWFVSKFSLRIIAAVEVTYPSSVSTRDTTTKRLKVQISYSDMWAADIFYYKTC